MPLEIRLYTLNLMIELFELTKERVEIDPITNISSTRGEQLPELLHLREKLEDELESQKH